MVENKGNNNEEEEEEDNGNILAIRGAEPDRLYTKQQKRDAAAVAAFPVKGGAMKKQRRLCGRSNDDMIYDFAAKMTNSARWIAL